MSEGPEGVAGRLRAVRERIARAAERAGRDPGEVLLVVVTKDVPEQGIREALEAGATDFGENRAQELVRKMEALSAAGASLRWHFVGTLQRNKVRFVAGRVALIHSIDSTDLARAVARRALRLGRTQDVLVEVNVSGERTKHGMPPEAVDAAVAELRGVEGLRARGLMGIAPAGSAEAARAAFRALRTLWERAGGPAEGLTELSMGMTGDFEVAVEEGATIVRVGTAIFGPRG